MKKCVYGVAINYVKPNRVQASNTYSVVTFPLATCCSVKVRVVTLHRRGSGFES